MAEDLTIELGQPLNGLRNLTYPAYMAGVPESRPEVLSFVKLLSDLLSSVK